MISVCSPSGLHEVTLGCFRSLSCTRSCTLHVNNYTGGFSHNGISYVLLHQTEAGSRSGSHCELSTPRTTNYCRNRSNLVLHLEINASHLWQTTRHYFCNLRRRSYRIACEKSTPCGNCSFRTGMVSLPKIHRLLLGRHMINLRNPNSMNTR